MNSLIHILSDLVKYDTSNKVGANLLLDEIIRSYIEPEGYSFKKYSYNGFNAVYFSINHNLNPKILLLGHLDTVDSMGWEEFEPFKLTIKNNKAYGLGVLDMKAGVATMIHMARRKKRSDIAYLLVTDEEEGGFNCSGNIVAMSTPEILPEFVLSPEPSNLEIEICSKGNLYVNILSKGLSSHSSRPELGINAVEQLLIYINELKQNEIFQIENKLLGKTTISLNLIDCPNKELSRVPDECKSTINIRYIPEINLDKIQSVLFETAKKHTSEYSKIVINDFSSSLHGAPVLCNRNNRYIKRLEKVIKDNGNTVNLIGNAGSSDIRFFYEKEIPSICFGPKGSNIHSPNEWLDLDTFSQYAKMLENFIDCNNQ